MLSVAALEARVSACPFVRARGIALSGIGGGREPDAVCVGDSGRSTAVEDDEGGKYCEVDDIDATRDFGNGLMGSVPSSAGTGGPGDWSRV